MMGYAGALGGGGWLIMVGAFVVVVVLIVVVVWGISAMSRSSGGSPQGPNDPEPPDILRERYARGEIGEEEFARAKQTLGDEG